MNYNAMTDRELLHYLDLYSEDPVVRRLVHLLGEARGSLITDLEEAGMDPQTLTFGHGWNTMYPGEYIEHLRSQLHDAEAEVEDLQYKLDEAVEERDNLKTRGIMEFIQEVWAEKAKNAEVVKDAMSTVKAFKDENTRLKEQIDMWARMNQPERNSL